MGFISSYEILSVLYEQTPFEMSVDGLKGPELDHGRTGTKIAPAIFTASCFLSHSGLEKTVRGCWEGQIYYCY